MLRNKFLILLTALFLLIADAAYCEDDGKTIILNSSGIPNRKISVNPASQNEGFSAVMYDNSKGLPTSEANAITETKEGFIWIGSYGGLVRYDGNTFERVPSNTGIASVKCLYVGRGGGLFVGTGDSGLFLLDREKVIHWNKSNGLKSSSIIAIAEDNHKTVYVATTAGIAMIKQDMKLTHVEDERINETYIRDIRLGIDGLIYGVTQVGDLFTLKNGKVINFLSRENCRIKGIISILPDPKRPGQVYVGTENSEVYHGSIENNFATMGIRDVSPLSLLERFEFIDNKIWICAGNGIGYMDAHNFYKIDNIPMENSIGHVMTDYEGNLWFTSSRHGVMKIVPNHFLDLYERHNLTQAVVNSTCLLDNKLFIATDSGLTVLDLENDKEIKSLPLKKATTASGHELWTRDLIEYLEGVRIRSIIRDSKGRLWISSWRKYGLLRYDDTNGELIVFNRDDGLFSERVRVVYELENGSIIAASTGGVNIISGDKIVSSYGEEAGLVNTEILTVTEGFNHDYILGSDGGGIYILGKDGTKHISTEEGLTSDIVMRVKRARDKKIYWIVTSNSIAFMDENYKVTTIKNFPYSNNYDIYENKLGQAWVLSSNGIYVIAVDDLIKNENIEPVHYNIGNGLPCIPTSNAYSELTDDGEIYIACLTGIVRDNVDKPFKKNSDLKVSVPYIDVDGKRIYPNENGNFTIPSNAHKLTVSSFVYNYSLNNPMVSWQLEGFENENVPISRSDLVPVDYTNLSGGTYNFVIQLMDLFRNPDKRVSVQIVKERAFYEQIWFYIIACWLFFVVLNEGVRFYVRRKTRKLEERNKENMTFIKEITEAFAKVIDMKDSYTNGHSMRVAKYTAMLAKELDYDNDTVEKFYRIALLHDIGKIGVPAEVLNKPGKLTDEEFEIIKSHTSQGYEALKEISIMPELATGAGSHHERPDGRGYPLGLHDGEIPRVAQIIAVADCFDAMYSNRPYRKRMNFDKVVSIIKEVSGTQLTSDVVDAFMRLVDRGEFRDPDDVGGGSLENIENVKSK
ncbi:MAG: HD domain-containing protein [Synergistaceae bacterium]|nr:HD domain-containing protein [Synergistaceae bacterium]